MSLLVIASYFSSVAQGFYYTFSSLLGLQAFVELGLYVVIMSLASKEWSKLHLDKNLNVSGDSIARSRLASLLRFVVKWYLGASLVFAIAVGIAGHLFLSKSGISDISWIGPWWTLVILAAIQLWLMPILTLVEACNQVAEINRFRFFQALAEAIALWTLVAYGAELWAAPGTLVVKVLANLAFLSVKYRNFFRSLWIYAGSRHFNWKTDILPMQWRLAAQGSVNYLVFSLFTPIMFHYHGPVVAGRMGMTLQIIGVIQMVSVVWVQTKLPLFGMLIAKKRYSELDNIWWRASVTCMGVNLTGCACMLLVVQIANAYSFEFAQRILDPMPTAIFLIAYALMKIPDCQAAYLRAFAREPFLFVGVCGGLLNGLMVYVLGSRYGPTGAAIGFAATVGAFLVPVGTWIWKKRRLEWRN